MTSSPPLSMEGGGVAMTPHHTLLILFFSPFSQRDIELVAREGVMWKGVWVVARARVMWKEVLVITPFVKGTGWGGNDTPSYFIHLSLFSPFSQRYRIGGKGRDHVEGILGHHTLLPRDGDGMAMTHPPPLFLFTSLSQRGSERKR